MYTQWGTESSMIDSTANHISFCDFFFYQGHNKYDAYLFCTFLVMKTSLAEGSADILFKMT